MVTEEASADPRTTRRDLGKAAAALLVIGSTSGACVHHLSDDDPDEPLGEELAEPPKDDPSPRLDVQLDHPRPALITTDTGTVHRVDVPVDGSVTYRHKDADRLRVTVSATVDEWATEKDRVIHLSQQVGESKVAEVVNILEGPATDHFDNRKRGAVKRTDVTLSIGFDVLDTAGDTLLSVTVSFEIAVRVYRKRKVDHQPAEGEMGGEGTFEIED